MPTFESRNFQTIFVGGAARKSTGNVRDSITSPLALGEIGLFKLDGTRLTEANAAAMAVGEEFEIHLRPSNSAVTRVISKPIKKGSIVKATRKAYTAETEQIDYIGYQGSGSDSIQAINLNEYLVTIRLDQNIHSNHGGVYEKQADYTSDSNATGAEVASGIAAQLIREFWNEPDQIMKVERLMNNAGTALTETYSPSYKNKYVAVSAAPTVVVGDTIRFGTATTDPCYLVASVDTTNNVITLDVPYQGTTASAVSCEVILAAATATAFWGIKLTGVSQPFDLAKIHNKKTAWRTSIYNFGTTVLTESVKASLGHGTERSMRELEWFTQGNDGELYRVREPFIFSPRALVSGNYNQIHLQVQESYTQGLMYGPIEMVYTLALPETAPNYAVTGTADDITDVLEVLIWGSANGNLSIA